MSESVLVQELDGESVLLDLNSEQYFGLDDVGSRMWNVLTTAESIGDAIGVLLTEFEVDPDRLSRDLHDLIERLVDHKLVHVSEA